MRRQPLFFMLLLLALAALACGLSSEQRAELDSAATTAAEAAAMGANAAATARAFAEENDLQATAAAAAGAAREFAATAQAFLGDADRRATAAAAAQAAATAASGAAASGGAAVATLQAGGYNLDYLREKFAGAVAVSRDENGNVILTVTETELNGALLLYQQEQLDAGETPQVSNLQVRFTSGQIIFVGQVTQPISGQMEAIFRPAIAEVVVDGQVVDSFLRFDLINVTVGSVQAPAPVVNFLEGRLNSTLFSALDVVPENVVLTSVVVGEGIMTITGRFQ